MSEKVIVLLGDEPIRRYFDVTDRSVETLSLVLDHTDVYEFSSQEEAEAFRFGMCVVKTPSARDFCELTEHGYATLLSLQKQSITV
jgi:hypothetical protein